MYLLGDPGAWSIVHWYLLKGAIYNVFEYLMYLIQFRLQFFYEYSLYIQEIVIIKATRLQAWAPAGGGVARVGRRPPPLENKKNVFWLYWGPFCYVFLIFEAFSPCGGFSLLFTSWWGPFFGLATPHKKMSAGAHDCKEGSRAFSLEIFCVTAI